MEYFRVVIEGGHMGPKKSYEMVRYMEAPTFNSLLNTIRGISRLKKKKNPMKSVISIRRVDYRSYSEGKKAEFNDPYLRNLQMGQLR